MLALESGRDRGAKLVQLIHEARREFEQANRPPRRSRRLGFSWLGTECERAVWYRWRWADELEEFDGRMLRLFETGELEEARFTADLRRVGATVFDRDQNDASEQISVSSHNGLRFGFLDSILRDLPFARADYLPCEMKTHNEKSFKRLVKDGVETAKPEHYAQLMGYMHEIEATEGLYLAKNKNDDELYAEFVPYDNLYCSRLENKATRVIKAIEPPPRISSKPDFFKCRFCKAHSVCHQKATPPRNCRTCQHAVPVEGSEWMCSKTGELMLASQQEQMSICGGKEHRFLRGLVPGKYAGTNEGKDKYELSNQEWYDDGNSRLPSDI